jgi:hypothetical protein
LKDAIGGGRTPVWGCDRDHFSKSKLIRGSGPKEHGRSGHLGAPSAPSGVNPAEYVVEKPHLANNFHRTRRYAQMVIICITFLLSCSAMKPEIAREFSAYSQVVSPGGIRTRLVLEM